ncbi:SCO2525 family SAM-dependent methyltransferase [Paractinoplanes maris]|uniref:SCO2525 family SAM-dependent methyltransferase n=1 Tax=Paractinoplanes maris TaxID=1734446 RepID=UPI00201FDE3A|nr:SCO2525 family SAM-dependent methyltransferase [Actinoplanes maris]
MSTNWDAFEPHAYWKQNYASLRGDDRSLLSLTRDFFGYEQTPTDGRRRGIDVGTGANLYPVLAMLPLCDEITLLEYGARNCEWLSGEIQRYSPGWDPYWRTLCQHPAYSHFGYDVRRRVARTAKVERGSVYELPEQRYHVGTMFFVAESITTDIGQFHQAIHKFVNCLVPGAPFAAAFMRNSRGYTVAGQDLPALAVTEDQVADCLIDRTLDLVVSTVDSRAQFTDRENAASMPLNKQLRSGYDGMILACGRSK